MDIASCQQIDRLSRLPLTNVTMILLDLSQVDFCDTSGIHALVNLRDEQLRARRQVSITRLTPHLRHLLEVMGVAPHFLQQLPNQPAASPKRHHHSLIRGRDLSKTWRRKPGERAS